MKFKALHSCYLIFIFNLASVLCTSRRDVSMNSEGHSGNIDGTQLLRLGFPMSLECAIPHDEDVELRLKWFKNGDPIEEDDEKYKIFPENSTLLIVNAAKDDVGNYRCQTMDFIPSQNVSIHVVSLAYKKMVTSLTVLQGDKLSLTCEVEGHPIPTVTWLKDGQNVEESANSSRFNLEKNDKGVPKGVLTIEETDYSDRAEYTCNISIYDLQYNTTTYVRVKDMYAALWPFLGICVEVFLLCLIIFIYEKRRAKNDFEESDTDQPNEQKFSDDKNKDSLRYRK